MARAEDPPERIEAPPRAVVLKRGEAAPFQGDLLPEGQLSTLLEKYVRLRSERDQLRADLDGHLKKAPELERIARAQGAVDERLVQEKVRTALEKRAREAELERDSLKERVKWYAEHYEAATVWFRQPAVVMGATLLILVTGVVATGLMVNLLLRLTDYYLVPAR